MACYAIRWRNSTRKDLRKIRPDEIARIIGAVEQLSADPFPVGHVKLTGSKYSYRIRVGDYRVLYEVLGEVLVIEVVRVAHRKDVYR